MELVANPEKRRRHHRDPDGPTERQARRPEQEGADQERRQERVFDPMNELVLVVEAGRRYLPGRNRRQDEGQPGNDPYG